MFVCSRCQGLTADQFCHCYILPMVNWGDGETTGLRQFDDWCAAALAEALDVTIYVHDIQAVKYNDPHNPEPQQLPPQGFCVHVPQPLSRSWRSWGRVHSHEPVHASCGLQQADCTPLRPSKSAHMWTAHMWSHLSDIELQLNLAVVCDCGMMMFLYRYFRFSHKAACISKTH